MLVRFAWPRRCSGTFPLTLRLRSSLRASPAYGAVAPRRLRLPPRPASGGVLAGVPRRPPPLAEPPDLAPLSARLHPSRRRAPPCSVIARPRRSAVLFSASSTTLVSTHVRPSLPLRPLATRANAVTGSPPNACRSSIAFGAGASLTHHHPHGFTDRKGAKLRSQNHSQAFLPPLCVP